MSDEKQYSLSEAHKYFARTLNGEVWSLLGNANRNAADDSRMVAAAFASYYHWLHAGTQVNAQRGEWIISRVYASLHQPALALRHAEACMALTEANPELMADFDRVYALEAMARALALSGRVDEARRIFSDAMAQAEAVADPEDRKIVLDDLAWGDWNGANQPA